MGIVISQLEDDRLMYQRQQERLPERISIASSLRDSFTGPAASNMQTALGYVNNANSLKSQIVAIGGNTGLSTTRYGSSTASISSQYGSIVSGVATATGASLGIAGLGTVIIAYGTVTQDLLKAYDYPKISGGDYGSDFPFTGDGYVTVTSSNVGIGVSTRLFQSSGSSLGIVFNIVSPAVDVSSLISQYNTAIGQVNTQSTSASSAQAIKGDYELQVWGLNRQLQENTDRLAEIEIAIGIASDPATGGPW